MPAEHVEVGAVGAHRARRVVGVQPAVEQPEKRLGRAAASRRSGGRHRRRAPTASRRRYRSRGCRHAVGVGEARAGSRSPVRTVPSRSTSVVHRVDHQVHRVLSAAAPPGPARPARPRSAGRARRAASGPRRSRSARRRTCPAATRRARPSEHRAEARRRRSRTRRGRRAARPASSRSSGPTPAGSRRGRRRRRRGRPPRRTSARRSRHPTRGARAPGRSTSRGKTAPLSRSAGRSASAAANRSWERCTAAQQLVERGEGSLFGGHGPSRPVRADLRRRGRATSMHRRTTYTCVDSGTDACRSGQRDPVRRGRRGRPACPAGSRRWWSGRPSRR